ncbi:hypothetical protein [Paracoccus sp. IB05]|uniref:hypothetical protein n=1 Tax=Paracoccus sp. IB05 TaxID=2779367 RepID=UPI0018E7C425|nr:hypothetical protein [Paracoccus sp. IB05]MBJ2150843.1 hypothetical protein [Paracoccus sp. IB05]
MIRYFNSFLPIVVFAFAGTLAATRADALVLICDLDVKANRGFSTTPLVISLEPGKGPVAVYDPLIHAIYGEPIEASQTAESKKIRLEWVVKNHRDEKTGRRANFGYSAKWNQGDGRISVRSHAHGYDNTPVVVYGNCKEEQQKTRRKGKSRG